MSISFNINTENKHKTMNLNQPLSINPNICTKRHDNCAHSQEYDYNEALKAFLQ
jgi:hypothetical protein